jgi:CheY-like chemotaxis protein
MAAKILVVEDDPLNRDLICKVLCNDSYQIVEASDGAQAFDLLRTQGFDLVITDSVMPKLNGLRFVEKLHLLHPRIPVIFITGNFSRNPMICITGNLSYISAKAILNEEAEIRPKTFELDLHRLRSTVQLLLRDSAPF